MMTFDFVVPLCGVTTTFDIVLPSTATVDPWLNRKTPLLGIVCVTKAPLPVLTRTVDRVVCANCLVKAPLPVLTKVNARGCVAKRDGGRRDNSGPPKGGMRFGPKTGARVTKKVRFVPNSANGLGRGTACGTTTTTARPPPPP